MPEWKTSAHTCNTGYRPSPGETINVRTCQSTGQWDITDRVCVGTYVATIIITQYCVIVCAVYFVGRVNNVHGMPGMTLSTLLQE